MRSEGRSIRDGAEEEKKYPIKPTRSAPIRAPFPLSSALDWCDFGVDAVMVGLMGVGVRAKDKGLRAAELDREELLCRDRIGLESSLDGSAS